MNPISFPREHNGHVDDGRKVRSSVDRKCPNCKSANFRETVSLEDCPDCGLRCDYWGSGANKVYLDTNAMHHAEEQERQRKLDEEETE